MNGDPIRFGGGRNVYGYVSGQVVVSSDPSGHQSPTAEQLAWAKRQCRPEAWAEARVMTPGLGVLLGACYRCAHWAVAICENPIGAALACETPWVTCAALCVPAGAVVIYALLGVYKDAMCRCLKRMYREYGWCTTGLKC